MSKDDRAWDIAQGIYLSVMFLLVTVAVLKACDDWESDCAETVKATVHGTAPDGTPAEIQSSWCGRYKPGRGHK